MDIPNVLVKKRKSKPKITSITYIVMNEFGLPKMLKL